MFEDGRKMTDADAVTVFTGFVLILVGAWMLSGWWAVLIVVGAFMVMLGGTPRG